MAQASPLDYAPVPEKPAFDLSVWLRLSVMMFLQFAVWGAWFVVLGRYLEKGLGFDAAQQGSIYGTMAFGAIFSMMFAGQLADRVLASQYLMAIFHLAGAALLFVLARMTGFNEFWWVAFAYALVYNPTLAISNSIAFANIKDSAHFAWVRVFGTVGWILAGLSVDFLLPRDSDVTNRPLLLAAGLSAALGLFSFLLPHTPPAGRAGGGVPFLRAFGLLRDPSFAIFFGVALAVAIALAFYYTFTSNYLGDLKVERIPTVMSLGQVSEVVFMLLLPFAIKYVGMKAVLAVGIGAWAVRYGLFARAADGTAFPLIVLGVLLHGICFDFFLAAGFIHTENKAPASIRGSAQALFSFLVYGVGMWIGNLVSGRVVAAYTTAATDAAGNPPLDAAGKQVTVRDWGHIWQVPAIGAAVCLVLFLIFWRDRKGKVDEAGPAARGVAAEPVVALNGDVGPGVAPQPVGNGGAAR